jgi:ribulose-5-phosphate 4-epimerase/fuculose-1-phosphate aldolase
MITAICDVLKECYSRGWISTRDGNGSVRRKNENWIYITPSGTKKQRLDAESLVKMEFQADKSLVKVSTEATGKPSGEIELHRRLLLELLDTRSVIHVHPTYTIAAMYAGYDLQALSLEFPEIHRYTNVAPNVPIVPAISHELAEATCRALELQPDGAISADIVGLDRHGVIAVARDPWTAFEHIERLEHICQIVLATGEPDAGRTIHPQAV